MAHTIAVVGGTGPQGLGLALRFARAGHTVIIGSRSPARAEEAAAAVRDRLGNAKEAEMVVVADTNRDACERADVVMLAIPYDGHDEFVETLPLAGRLVISCVNPLGFDKVGAFGIPVDAGQGSAAETTQRIHPDANVVGAFHHLSAVSLSQDGLICDEDVLVVGDDQDAKQIVMELAADVTGRIGVDAGKLRMARQLEPLTAVLISINRRYKVQSGIRIAAMA